MVADVLSDFCFITENSGLMNLKNEKVSASTFFVGNTMIDTMVKFEDKIQESGILDKLGLSAGEYYLVTFHRPENVDSYEKLNVLLSILELIANQRKSGFPGSSQNIFKFDKIWIN